MTRAAIAYGAGWVGLVVADGDAPPLALRLSASYELGHREQRKEELVVKKRSWDMERVVASVDVYAVAATILEQLRAHAVASLAVGIPEGATAEHMTEIGAVVATAGIAVEYVPAPPGRVDGDRALPKLEEAFVAGDARWPSFRGAAEGDASCCRKAGLLLLPPPEPSPEGEAEEKPRRRRQQKPAPPPVPDVERWREATKAPLPVAESEVAIGPRTAGLDSGDRWVSLTIVEGASLPVQLVFSDTFPVGSMQPLARPRKRRLPDGRVDVIAERHAITRDDARIAVNGILALLTNYGVRRLRIEWFDDVHMDPRKSPQAHASTAKRLAGTREVAARVEQAIEDRELPIEVDRVRAATWRASVAGTASTKGAGKREIEPAIQASITGWNVRTDEHQRDSAGCAVHDILEELKRANPPEEKAARARLPSRKRDTIGEKLRGKRKRLERREGAGCGCPTAADGKVHRHKGWCLASAPHMGKGWAQTKMTEEEWKSTLEARQLAVKRWGDGPDARIDWTEATPIWRRDAITRALAADPEFDVRTPFEACTICMMPARSRGERLPPSSLTCQCGAEGKAA